MNTLPSPYNSISKKVKALSTSPLYITLTSLIILRGAYFTLNSYSSNFFIFSLKKKKKHTNRQLGNQLMDQPRVDVKATSFHIMTLNEVDIKYRTYKISIGERTLHNGVNPSIAH